MTYIDEGDKLEQVANKLPPQAVKALGSPDVVMIISGIGDKFDLLLDQQGALYELTRKVLTGEMRADALVPELKARAAKEEDWDDLDDKKIEEIVQILNARIFVPIREAMQKSSETGEETPMKEDVLKEIENPTPTEYRKSSTPTPTVTSQIPAQSQAQVPPTTPAPTAAPVSTPPAPAPKAVEPVSKAPEPTTAVEILPEMDIMEAKLAGAVKMPIVNVQVKTPGTAGAPATKQEVAQPTIKTPPPAPKPISAPQKYSTDPYREPPTA